MPEFYCTYNSPIGNICLQSNGNSLCGLQFHDLTTQLSSELPIFRQTILWLDTYFSGQKPTFFPPVELFGSDFQKTVWKELMNIDFGKTATYGEIARKINCRSAQAVGQAISKNPLLLIIPCHRVISKNGIGGFSAGTERKKWLQNHEQTSMNIYVENMFNK